MNISECKELLDRAYKSELSNIEVARQLTGNTYTKHYAVKVTSIARQIIDKLVEDSVVDKEGRVLSQVTYGDGSQLRKILANVTKVQDKTPKDLLIYHGYDPLAFELEKHEFNIWQNHSVQDGTVDLVSSRLRAKPLQKIVTQEVIREAIQDLEIPKDTPHKIISKDNGKILEIPVVDLHLGKLSWEGETGYNYDLKIAEKVFKAAINEVLARVKRYNIQVNQILYPVGQDFFNIDNDKNETFKGTDQDTDTRMKKIFRKGIELNYWAVEKLKQLNAPIDICYVPGNHDISTSFFLMEVINARYSENKNININNDLKPRKYYKYGNNLIGLGHLEKVTKKRQYNLMASEAPEMWGSTIYREYHIGHLHSRSLELTAEMQGCSLRHLPALTFPDNYHIKSGYIGVTIQLQTFIWDWENGLETIINAVVREKDLQTRFNYQ